MQDVHGVASVLAGGVDVAADVEAVLGNVVAGQAAGDLLLCLQGLAGELARLGFTEGSAKGQLGLAAHPSRWLAAAGRPTPPPRP